MTASDAGGNRLDYLPWEYVDRANVPDRQRQADRRQQLARTGDIELAADVFIAGTAAVFCDRLRMGERSYIGADAYVTGEISVGADSTINPFADVRGRITLGDGVRIGAHTSLLAFNHGTGPGQPIFEQPHTSLGIAVGDDGSHVVILDGVTIGSHSIVGAGSVVTKDVDEWAVVGGNPARKIRDRRGSRSVEWGHAELADRAAVFAARAREQVGEILKRCHDGQRFIDRPGVHLESVNRAIRPWCDAIEISDLLLRRAPDGYLRDDLIRRLRARQDPVSGLIAPGDLADGALDMPIDTRGLSAFEGLASYQILCVGYASSSCWAVGLSIRFG